MNTQTPRDPRVDPHEWQLQEAALAQERGAAAAGDGVGLGHYRLLHRALREVPAPQLPADFAAALARRVERERLLDGRWERRLLAAMLLLLAGAGGVQLFLHGDAWLAAVHQALPALPRWGNGWGLLLGLALAWSPLSGLLQRHSRLQKVTR
ncbi:hypothetical protein [Tahibacter harae]|uniref:Uncharacterized protein n=1 Tax=Tahibacter harae TaxID=2963937 RepID=A0ABT1QV24_9GAMM|nr:hypothetical protein [Tahibacter harae]MCQ4166134.1 hypothetical protein [Tahibacter harae]